MTMKKEILTEFVFDTNTENSGISFLNDYAIKSEVADCKNILHDLKKVNIFVGANNTGKSRIIRSIFRQNKLMHPSISNGLLGFFDDVKKLIENTTHTAGQLRATVDLIRDIQGFKTTDFFHIDSTLLTRIDQRIVEIKSFISDQNFFRANNIENFPGEMNALFSRHEEVLIFMHDNRKFHRLYIPILRGLRPLSAEDDYLRRTNDDYFRTELDGPTQTVSTGLSMFKEIRSQLLGSHAEREFIRKYEDFLSKNFFEGTPVTLVPREKSDTGSINDVLYVTFGSNGENDRAIYENGDGVQSIICITFPIFRFIQAHKDNKNDLLFTSIEEPEMYLHPAMQRKLVEVFMTELSSGIQYFITTHSNHFLDLFSEPENNEKISVYSVTQDEAGLKTIKKETDLTDPIYELLGARPSSLLLANKTIWVEGVSDRIYIRHALTLYFKETQGRGLSEGLDFAFVEYGGSNLQHYIESEQDLEISSISNYKSVFMIADKDDSEGVDTAKKERYAKISVKIEGAGGKFKITDGREIENYITPEILRKVWSTLPASVTQDEFLNSPLPEFLASKEQLLHISNNSFSGNKKIIAEKITKEQKEWKDISKLMQKLIEEIVLFVRK